MSPRFKGVETKTSITLWGEEFEIVVVECYEYEEMGTTPQQERRKKAFMDGKAANGRVVEMLLKREGHLGARPSVFLIWDNGHCALLFDDEGIAVALFPQKEVFRQSRYFAENYNGMDSSTPDPLAFGIRNGKCAAVQSTICFGGEKHSISVAVPPQISPLAQEYIEIKFPSEGRHEVILSNRTTEVNFCFSQGIVEGDDPLEKRRDELLLAFEQQSPHNRFFTRGTVQAEGGMEVAYFDVCINASDTPVYYLIFLADLPTSPKADIFGAFLCPFPKRKEWEPIFLQMIKTIRHLEIPHGFKPKLLQPIAELEEHVQIRKIYCPVIQKFKEETVIPAVVLTAKKGENLSATASKMGGSPYMPKGFDYPKGSDGEPLFLLAQLNFEELPALQNFPQKGILQVYTSVTDDLYGFNYNAPLSQENFRVIYHENITREQDAPHIKMPENAEFPFTGELALTGILGNCPMSTMHYQFNEKISRHLEKHGLEYDDTSIMWDMLHEALYFDHHMIGGYPFFTQFDPRENDPALEKFDTLLLQLTTDAENNIFWGDSGILNFHIPLENLKSLDFSEVLYNFDCY